MQDNGYSAWWVRELYFEYFVVFIAVVVGLCVLNILFNFFRSDQKATRSSRFKQIMRDK